MTAQPDDGYSPQAAHCSNTLRSRLFSGV